MLKAATKEWTHWRCDWCLAKGDAVYRPNINRLDVIRACVTSHRRTSPCCNAGLAHLMISPDSRILVTDTDDRSE